MENYKISFMGVLIYIYIYKYNIISYEFLILIINQFNKHDNYYT